MCKENLESIVNISVNVLTVARAMKSQDLVLAQQDLLVQSVRFLALTIGLVKG